MYDITHRLALLTIAMGGIVLGACVGLAVTGTALAGFGPANGPPILAWILAMLCAVPVVVAFLSSSYRPAWESPDDLDHLLDLKRRGRFPLRTPRGRTGRVRPGRLVEPTSRPERPAWDDDRYW